MNVTGYCALRQKEYDNRGFSLVELLVCIAILALISVPILAGFRTSAYYTSRAHKTQMVTAYAQEVLETIKSVEVKEFKDMILAATDKDGNITGNVDETEIDTALQAQFDSYSDELFTKIKCTRSDIDIGGTIYDMEVVFNPADYSQKKDASEDAFAMTSADDANVYAVNEVDAVDGMLFPVIADEISQYEGLPSAPSAVLYNLRGMLKKAQTEGADEETQIAEIYSNLTKTVKVTIGNDTAGTTTALGGSQYVQNTIKVSCDLIYESSCSGVSLKQVYNVFSGNYELLGKLVTGNDGTQTVEEWEKGGNIYIFARAYQDRYLGGRPQSNIVEIQNNYSGIGKLNVYLVRGYYYDSDLVTGEPINKSGLHFNEVLVNSHTYSHIPESTPLSGEWSDGNTYFHTNIKGMITGAELQSGDFEQTIGMKKPSLRCYEVSVTMTEQDTGKEVVNISTTKEIR